MAWQTIDSANLYSSGALVGYVYFEYDTSSTGSSRSCRVRIGERSGYYFSVDFRDFTVNGDNRGTIAVTQSSGTIWSGSIPSGNRSVTWYCPWYSGTVNYSLSGNVPSAGTPPSGGHIEFVSHTWNSVTVTSSVSSWGSGYSNTPKLEGIFIDPVATSSDWDHTGRVVLRTYTNATTMTFSDISNTNYSGAYNGGYTLKGMTPYKISCYASTELGKTTDFDNTVRYTPPAPGQLSYTDEGNNSWRVVYTGVAADNSTSYTAADLTRTFRYKDTADANWTYVQQDTQAALTDVTISHITIPAQHTVEIEAWMTYKGEQSEVSATSITNAAPTARLYGSIAGQDGNESAEIEKLYGSVHGKLMTNVSYDQDELADIYCSAFDIDTFMSRANRDGALLPKAADGFAINKFDIIYGRQNGGQISALITIYGSDGSKIMTYRPYGSSAAPSTSTTRKRLAEWGFTADFSSMPSTTTTTRYISLTTTYTDADIARKITKFYGSASGVAKLIFEDNS